ncbi:MAG: hypothetical protein H7Y13_02865 [Sphingobacteriaceae bacterium]|nr:hypothetical protein [Sphingobacteriaceae bacterium]
MRQLSIIFLLFALVACKGKKSAPAVVPTPGSAVLVSPAANATCNQGAVVSTTESTVLLTWSASANTETYDITIKNLATGVSTLKTSTATQLSVNLNQNTPYSWYVTSKSSQTSATKKSETWKFYNAGTAVSFYAPFPADLILPTNGQIVTATASKTVLDWNGSDTDNDIAGYDVLMGTTNANMSVIKSNLTESIANDVTVASGLTYYWQVKTKDSKGNTSTSDTFTFKVN